MKTREFISSFAAVAILMGSGTPASAFQGPEGQLNYRYTEAVSGKTLKKSVKIELPTTSVLGSKNVFSTDAKMLKTIFLAQFGNVIVKALNDHEDACKSEPMPHPLPGPITRSLPASQPATQPATRPVFPEVDSACSAKYKAIAELLKKDIVTYDLRLNEDQDMRSDMKVVEFMDLVRKLAKNIEDSKGPYRFPQPEMRTLSTGGAAGGLNVTGGGAKDIEHFRKIVTDGFVPAAELFVVEGFLSEFDLSLSNVDCNELICVHPAVTVDRDLNKLFIQVGMNSNVTKETFKRSALNLSVVIDISGSMQATDGTEKNRLEWAKDAVRHTINEMNANDTVSIVIFDTDMEILVSPTTIRTQDDRKAILQKVDALQPRGSTNLGAGLRQGYEFVSKNIVEGLENRVILISDAGVNTGIVKNDDIMKLVTDFAGENIGLTAVGLGLNFNQDLINTITKSKGGNYIFVQNGKSMFRFFESFDYLVTPVAHNFKVEIDLGDIKAKLVKAYGIPTEPGKEVHDLINIRSLFFSEEGGAMLLEYDLNK